MKKLVLLPLFLAFGLLQITAQNPGCDGSRYKNDLFPTVKKTTVPYGSALDQFGQQVFLSMDVYEPEGDNLSARPVVVLAHGGSFMVGDKGDMKQWCELLAKKGYVAASIKYRLYPFIILGFPDSVDIFDQAVRSMSDMKAAVRFFRQDAATSNQFRADIDNIFAGGYSAGAVTALHAGFLDNDDVLPPFIQTIVNNHGGLNGNTGSASNQSYSSSIKAILSMSGGLYRSYWVDSLNVPLASIHGTDDETVPFYYGLAANIAYLEGSGSIHPQAEEAGLLHDLQIVPGGGHTDIYDPTELQFKPHVDTFWTNATTILEYLACQLVGTNEANDWEENWSVFPNPTADGAFTVELPESVRRAAVTLTDVSGKIVFQTKNIQNQEIVRLNSLPTGIYTVRISDMHDSSRQFVGKKLVVK